MIQIQMTSRIKERKEYLNLPSNVGEIVEALARDVKELAVLLIGAISAALSLQELEHEGAARADFRAAGQEVAADKGLEHTGLAATLAADDGDLRELDGRLGTELREDVLELVHNGDHRVSERRIGG